MIGFSSSVILTAILWCYSSAQMMEDAQEILMLKTAIDKIVEIKMKLEEQEARSAALYKSVMNIKSDINESVMNIKSDINETVMNIKSDINDWRNEMKESQTAMELTLSHWRNAMMDSRITMELRSRQEQEVVNTNMQKMQNILTSIQDQTAALQNCATVNQLEHLHTSVATEQNETRNAIENCSGGDKVTRTSPLLSCGNTLVDLGHCDGKLKRTNNGTDEIILNLCRESLSVAIACEEGSYYFEGLCYHISTQKGTWQEGKNYCLRMSGSYAKISRPEEWAFVARRVKDNTWIGLSDIEKEGSFKWDSDFTYVFTNWKGSQPDNHAGKEHCIHFRQDSYKWNDWTCAQVSKYLCERDEDHGECPDGYLQFGGSCYHISSNKKNWWDGMKACKDMGAYYAKIENEAEDSFIRRHLDEHTWFGLSDLDREGHYKWSKDGEEIFNLWNKGQPDDSGNAEDCVHLWKNANYLLNDSQCRNQFNFLCTMEPTVRVV